MKKTAVILITILLSAAVITGAASAAGNITFDGIPKTGAWTYADSNITIPLNVSNYTTGLSAFRLIVDITGASENKTYRPTYTTTSGGYDDIGNTYEFDTWCFAYNETNITTPAPAPAAANRTRYILTHSGISIYDKPFGNETFQIGTILLPLENRTDITRITLHAYMTEAYDELGLPVALGNTGNIIIASRPYPQNVTYYNNDTKEELEKITGLYQNKTYGNISAYVYAENRTKNLFDASLGDTIIWSQAHTGIAKYVANITPLNTNPVSIAGNQTGTAYLKTTIKFPAPNITSPAIVQYTNNNSKYWKEWTWENNNTHRVQTGVYFDYLYVLEIPADFSLKQDASVKKTVRVLNYTLPDDEQLNVYMSSEQFDNVGNEYRLYYIKNPSIRVNYTIDAGGIPVKTNNQRILTANSTQIDTGVAATLNFSVPDDPEVIGAYRDKLTFVVNFTKIPAPVPTAPPTP